MSNLFNDNVIEGKWSQLKGFFQVRWGRLLNSDAHQAKGGLKEVAGFAQQKLGEAQDGIRHAVDKGVGQIGEPEKDERNDFQSN